MYINKTRLDKFLSEGWDIKTPYFLSLLKNNENDLDAFSVDLEALLKEGYVKYLKDGKTLRIDKKGTDFLKDLGSSSTITPDNQKIADWLIDYYKKYKPGGIVKNKTEVGRRLQWFSDQTGFIQNKLAVLIRCFIQDTYDQSSGLSLNDFKEQNPRMVINNICENLFWTPKDHFARHYKLDESPLYIYLEDNEEYINLVWEKNNIE